MFLLTAYDSPLAVVMLHINTESNPNPNLNPNCAIINLKKHDVVHFSGRSGLLGLVIGNNSFTSPFACRSLSRWQTFALLATTWTSNLAAESNFGRINHKIAGIFYF